MFYYRSRVLPITQYFFVSYHKTLVALSQAGRSVATVRVT